MSQVWAVSMVRNEADVIGYNLRHLLSEGVNGFVVADNGSDDATPSILREFASEAGVPVHVVYDPEVGYYQGRKMTALADMAGELGAAWIVPFDADELWCGRREPLAAALQKAWADVVVIGVGSWSHVGTPLDDPAQENPFLRLSWRRTVPSATPKMAFRWCRGLTVHQGNDGILNRAGRLLPHLRADDTFEIRHFQARSLAQFEAKIRQGAAAYAAAPDLEPGLGSHWRKWGEILSTEGGLEAVYRERFFMADDRSGYVDDAAPWRRWGRA